MDEGGEGLIIRSRLLLLRRTSGPGPAADGRRPESAMERCWPGSGGLGTRAADRAGSIGRREARGPAQGRPGGGEHGPGSPFAAAAREGLAGARESVGSWPR